MKRTAITPLRASPRAGVSDPAAASPQYLSRPSPERKGGDVTGSLLAKKVEPSPAKKNSFSGFVFLFLRFSTQVCGPQKFVTVSVLVSVWLGGVLDRKPLRRVFSILAGLDSSQAHSLVICP